MQRMLWFFCVPAVFLFTSLSNAQIPDTLWTKTYGSWFDDRGMSVQVTSDSGYIIGGYAGVVGGGYDFYLVRTDRYGDTLWTETYGGPSHDYGQSVRQTSDGGYVIAGYSYSFGGVRPDVYVVKTDSLGIMEWDRVYGGAEDDAGADIQQTFDGGYIITGYTSSFGVGLEDLWLLRTDSSGDTAWTQTYGTAFCDCGAAAVQSADSGFVITGANGSGAASSLWILKTDQNGVLLWSKIYYPGNYSSGSSLQETTDGGYVIGGTSFAGAGESDFWLLKTDAQGDTMWTRTYGGQSSDDAWEVETTSDGGYILVGRTWSFGAGWEDVYIVRTDSLGDTLWTRVYGGSGFDYGTSIALTPDGGYIVAGSTESFGAGDYDVWLLRIETDPYGVEEYERVYCGFEGITINPNPFCDNLQIRFTIHDPGYMKQKIRNSNIEMRKNTLKIYDATGRVVKSFILSTAYYILPTVISWNGIDDANRRLPSGVYFIKFEVGDWSITEKVILVR